MRIRAGSFLSFFALLMLVSSAIDVCSPGGGIGVLAGSTDPSGPLDEEEDGDAESASSTSRHSELQKLRLSLLVPLHRAAKPSDLPLTRLLTWHAPRQIFAPSAVPIPIGSPAPLRLRI